MRGQQGWGRAENYYKIIYLIIVKGIVDPNKCGAVENLFYNKIIIMQI
jgi:hypothetical protein